MSGTVALRGVHVGYGAQAVLAGVDLIVGPGDRVGVVAPNGVGKSTLLRVLAGDLVPEAGSVTRAPASTSVVLLAQEPDVRPGESLAAHLARRTGVAAAQVDLDAAAVALARDAAGADDAYAQALEHWLALGGADLPERSAEVTAALGLPDDLLSAGRGAAALSGGQLARLALAAVLLARPDILLLDEPTNDLDSDGLRRLEQHVQGTSAGVVLVSHDRGAARTARAVERLDAEAPDVVREPWRLQLSIAQAPRAGDVVAALRDAVLVRGDVRLGPLTLSLAWPERLRLVGPNGSGKTTLVDGLLGREPLRAGTRYVGPSVVPGELDQSRRLFDTADPVLDVVRRQAGGEPTQIRTLLAKFRLPGDIALRPARSLSPGERTRANLAILQARGVNWLILDEPTNHLDIEAIEQLEAALADFGGALLLVTHDRRLAEAVRVDRTLDVRDLR